VQAAAAAPDSEAAAAVQGLVAAAIEQCIGVFHDLDEVSVETVREP
jgi:hypothetical protein